MKEPEYVQSWGVSYNLQPTNLTRFAAIKHSITAITHTHPQCGASL